MSKANCQIRPYQIKDEHSVLQLLQKNIPQYFAPSEYNDLVDYLKKERDDYFVIEQVRTLIGAGGINYFPKEKKARISWDFLDPEVHGQGLGSQLLAHRIDHIRKQKNYTRIEVRTSQFAFRFYEKGGFQTKEIHKDYWAPGFDLYLMEMTLEKAV